MFILRISYFWTMTIKLLCIGKTDDARIQSLIDEYTKRLNHYIRFEIVIIPDLKKRKTLSTAQQKEKEGQLLLSKLTPSDHIILLDERGKDYTSVGFSKLLQKKMNSGYKTLVFIIGGPYGFSQTLYDKGYEKVALSTMTFSHQMVRLFIVEQVYRGFTILKGEPYHHR